MCLLTGTPIFQYNKGLMEIFLDILNLIALIACGVGILAVIIVCWYFAALLLSDAFYG